MANDDVIKLTIHFVEKFNHLAEIKETTSVISDVHVDWMFTCIHYIVMQ